MNLVINDPATLQQLRQAPGIVNLTDPAGACIGRFVPSDPIAAEPPISREELERRKQQPGRRLADILGDLEKRA